MDLVTYQESWVEDMCVYIPSAFVVNLCVTRSLEVTMFRVIKWVKHSSIYHRTMEEPHFLPIICTSNARKVLDE